MADGDNLPSSWSSKDYDAARQGVHLNIERQVEKCLQNKALLLTRGANPDVPLKEVIVLLVVGDMVHPEMGAGYIPMGNDLVVHREIDRRNAAVERMVGRVADLFCQKAKPDALEEICASSPHKVLYLSRDAEGLLANIRQIFKDGMSAGEFGQRNIIVARQQILFVFQHLGSFYP